LLAEYVELYSPGYIDAVGKPFVNLEVSLPKKSIPFSSMNDNSDKFYLASPLFQPLAPKSAVAFS